MEGDLRAVYGVRYSDRWRYDENGQRRLTLREIWVMLQDLPGDSRVVKKLNGGRPRWDDDTFLIADLIHVWTGKPHPARPKPVAGTSKLDSPRRQEILQKRAARKRRERNAQQRSGVARGS